MNTLIDSFGRKHTYLRLAVTDRCNLRCHYCMPSDTQWRRPEEILTDDEIVQAATLFARLGVEKIRLTGGEPTVRPGLEKLIARLAAIPGLHTVAMTTNGMLLREQAASLRRAGLAPYGLNISLDSLRQERLHAVTGTDALEAVLEGIEAAIQAGFTPVKLNVVVMTGVNEDEVCDFVAFAIEKNLNVRFIEYMPFPGNQWEPAKFVSYACMKELIGARYRLLPEMDSTGMVAKNFTVAGAAGRVSFITPLSESFCQACSRLRLTADGVVKTCLFHPAELNLRELLRGGASEEEIATALHAAVAMKPEGHPPVEALMHTCVRSMVEIGG